MKGDLQQMKAKRIILSLALIISAAVSVSAQGERIFLFDNFAKGYVKFKNGAVNVSMMNYDANNGKMYFMQGETLMEMTGPEQVDSIQFGERNFIGRKGDFVEKYTLQHGTVGILWRIHKIHEGYVGAYGQTSQVGARKIELQGNFGMGNLAGAGGGMYNGSFGTNQDDKGGQKFDIWKVKSANTYIFEKNGKEYAINRIKNLYKAFPQYKKQLQEFAKEHELDLMTADKAVILIDYLLSL